MLSDISSSYIESQIELMNSNITKAPHVAIGTAKDLLETICKTILESRKEEFGANDDLPELIKKVSKVLRLIPDDIDDSKKGAEAIKKILRSFAPITQGLCELRKFYGSGHGKEANFKGLSARHAALAVGTSNTLVHFLWETHKVK
jgi:hypothetical protein